MGFFSKIGKTTKNLLNKTFGQGTFENTQISSNRNLMEYENEEPKKNKKKANAGNRKEDENYKTEKYGIPADLSKAEKHQLAAMIGKYGYSKEEACLCCNKKLAKTEPDAENEDSNLLNEMIPQLIIYTVSLQMAGGLKSFCVFVYFCGLWYLYYCSV